MILKIFLDTTGKINRFLLKKTFITSLQVIAQNKNYALWCESNKLIVNLVITNNEQITKLNHRWRNKNQNTDVLSFPYFTNFLVLPPKITEIFGEIYLSYQQCQAQAEYLNHSLDTEMQILLIHSLLHLFGYDHINDNDYQDMLALEKKIILTEKFGVYNKKSY